MNTNPDSVNFSLTKQRNPLYGKAGFRFAYAFSKLVGAQVFIQGLFGESLVSKKESAWK